MHLRFVPSRQDIKCYDAIVKVVSQGTKMEFQEIQVDSGAEEVERIAVEQMITNTKDTELGTTSLKHAMLSLKHNVDILKKYVAAVMNGEQKAQPRVMREIAAAAFLPTSSIEDFSGQAADVALVALLSALTKATYHKRELVDEFMMQLESHEPKGPKKRLNEKARMEE